MTFPTTGLLDDFNRADGAPGANWTTPYKPTLTQPLAIISNQIARAAGGSGAADGMWIAADFGPDSEVYTSLTSGSGQVNLYLRMFLTTDINGYACGYTMSTGVYNIFRYVDGASTKLGTSGLAATLQVGDKVGVEVYGQDVTEVVVYQWTSSAWYEMGSRSDNAGAIMGAGKIGLSFPGVTPQVDDFSGGTMIGDPEDHSDFAWPTDMQQGQAG